MSEGKGSFYRICSAVRNRFFRKDMELRVRLFHVLALTGGLICLIMGILSAVTGATANVLINFFIGLMSLGLLFYSARSGRYQLCYGISIVVIFLGLFTSMFFTSGGYRGGMPLFFVFAVVYTAYMLDGWRMLAMTVFEVFFYSGLCIFAYCFPETVQQFESEAAGLLDQIMALITVSATLGGTMSAQFYLYQRQQKELEKAREEAEAANRAKSDFLANMSHEIRTPIHIVMGMNEIISRESRNLQIRQCADRIDEAGQMLLSLVDNVLDVSKIESGRTEVVEKVYEVRELAEIMTLIGRTRCEKKRVGFSLEVGEEVPPALLGDIMHIKQITGNLLSNAAKYTEEGTVTASLNCIPGEGEEVLLQIRVRDTGIGIRQEAIPTLFDMFSRADLHTTRAIEGTGLGLAIVRKLTDLMHGHVEVESVFGEGSTFTVTLPQKRAALPEEERKQAHSSFLAPEARVLVVDDNEGNCELMRTLLSETLMVVDTAQSGPECLDMVERGTYHLILMDCMMPGMDGLETLQKLREKPGFAVPVVALTANAAAGMEEKLLNAGFAAFLTKPIPWSRLERTMFSLLPQELLTRVETSGARRRETDRKLRELETELLPYGVVLEQALEYFRDDLDQCIRTAAIFLKYGQAERDKAERLWQSGDYEHLRYLVHTLKGKAKNMGIDRLWEVSGHLEMLCTQGKTEEADCLMPYLLYLWRQGAAGLSLLLAGTDTTAMREPAETALSPEQCIRELPRLLAQLRRKQSLQYLDTLMEAVPGDREELQPVRDAVTAFDFERAEHLFERYREKEGAK